ncbi:MAG: thiamine-phosphate kinase [Chthoniobacter sp.]
MKTPRRARQTAPASLADWGEDRLVAALTQGLPVDAQVLVGPGDDCAVIGRPRDARWQLLKTDAVVEGVHFLPAEDPRRVGWKALCRAISDIAAMGGTPAHALITLAAPATTPVARVQALYTGLRKAARKYGVSIVGGETSRSPGPLFLSIALTGWVVRSQCVAPFRRASPAICSTSPAGSAALSRAGISTSIPASTRLAGSSPISSPAP